MKKTVVMLILIFSLIGCSTIMSAFSAISGLFGSSQDSTHVNNNLDAQNGDNKSNKVESDKIENSKVSGRDQTEYSAKELVVNQGSIWDHSIAFILGFVLSSLATFLVGWHIRSPRWIENRRNLKKSLTSK